MVVQDPESATLDADHEHVKHALWLAALWPLRIVGVEFLAGQAVQ
jgi:hypothetical protein